MATIQSQRNCSTAGKRASKDPCRFANDAYRERVKKMLAMPKDKRYHFNFGYANHAPDAKPCRCRIPLKEMRAFICRKTKVVYCQQCEHTVVCINDECDALVFEPGEDLCRGCAGISDSSEEECDASYIRDLFLL